ncbi:GNAT family N-acetyltransferase [Actinocrispum wychmicini]|uniref:Acetyltransferase (GNAT) family protein n=1 Tax=Actinocrispum wychmicini TaxID=1213861 RepID=A0A4R2JZL9_9PSEU|nr:GNAT family protein [Actinocrispum wychmicini]TCO65434.1 acetyltransferase (GNAT) family protein [Actinocrispum wychmicini]
MRTILARGKGVALAEWTDGDGEWFDEHSDGVFDVDRDGRPLPFTAPIHRAVVTTEDGAEVLGVVSWHPVTYGPSYGCLAWNFGRALLPSARGRGIGTEVLRLLVRHLFDSTDIDRIEGSTDVTNTAAQRSMAKAGFTREGVVRGGQLRDGERHDLISFSILRSDVTDEKLTASQIGRAELASGDG